MKTAWLALLLLGSISAVAAMLTGTWRAPAAVEATADQMAAAVDPVDDTPTKAPNWPEEAARQEMAARQAVDPDPTPVLRGSEPPATPFPAAAETNVSTNANAGAKMPMPAANAQQIKRIRDSKAEMRAKRSKAAANTRTCPATNPWTGLFQRLSLVPPTRCSTI